MKKLLCLFLLLQFSTNSFAQEKGLFVYNVGLGAISSGIGSIINKPKEVKWTKAFVRGVWQGALGGAVNFAGKKTMYLVVSQREVAYALPSRLIHAAGLSIMNNASLYRPFLQSWYIDYGPARFDFSFGTEKSFRVRFLPQTITAVINASKQNKFDLKTSLYSGTFTFYNDVDWHFKDNGGLYVGLNYGRGMKYIKNQADETLYPTIAHELIHSFQYEDYQVFNTWVNPLGKKIKTPWVKKLLTNYVYVDLSAFQFFYRLENYQIKNKIDNYFEFEAYRFSGIL